MVRKVRVYSRAKAEPRLKQKAMGEGAGAGAGRKAVRKTACNQPLEIFETASAFLEAGSSIPDWPTECQPVSGCQIPSGYRLQRSTVG